MPKKKNEKISFEKLLEKKKPKILWADDDVVNLKFGIEFLKKHNFEVVAAKNGKEAYEKILKEYPDVIILDVDMPKMNGYEVCKKIKSHKDFKHIPVIMITGLKDMGANIKGLEAGADDYITKPFNVLLLEIRIKNSLKNKYYYDQLFYYQQKLSYFNEKLKDYNKELEKKVKIRTAQIQETQEVTIFALAKLAESRDPETGAHLERIRLYSRYLAIELQKNSKYKDLISDEFVENMYRYSPLHDIGKVGIRDSILLKPGKLTPEEFEEMKKHTIIGGRTIELAEKKLKVTSNFLKMGKEIAYCHHEKWNGKGYPFGLKGTQIPLSARILAVADVYDALTHKRVYKPAFPHRKAVNIITEEAGKHFDPYVVETFVNIEKVFEEILKTYKEEDDLYKKEIFTDPKNIEDLIGGEK